MKTMKVQVNEDVVNDIQLKDVEAQMSKEVIVQIIESHKFEEDTSFMESPVFKAYQKDSADKQIAFEKAKNDMAESNIPAHLRDSVKEWNLNYFTCELTLTIQ